MLKPFLTVNNVNTRLCFSVLPKVTTILHALMYSTVSVHEEPPLLKLLFLLKSSFQACICGDSIQGNCCATKMAFQ